MDSGVLEVEWLEQVTLIRLEDQGSEILACHFMRTCSIYIRIMRFRLKYLTMNMNFILMYST